METIRITDEILALAHFEPIPGRGFFPIQAYLVLGKEPVLVDMGAVRYGEPFLASLEAAIDPADLSAIVLTHPDADHFGPLPRLLERAPRAKLVLNWISTGKLSASIVPPLPRLLWRNPGETFAVGGRSFQVLRPPMYDCPSTIALFELRSRALFTSDAFGAFVPEVTHYLSEQPTDLALEGMSHFCRANSPWLSEVRPEGYHAALKELAALSPAWLLSAHLPPASEREVPALLARAACFPQEGRPPLPGQQVLDAVLASLGKAA